jgi:hypothetical protein
MSTVLPNPLLLVLTAVAVITTSKLQRWKEEHWQWRLR